MLSKFSVPSSAVALVVQGGGMRAAFTAGGLDALPKEWRAVRGYANSAGAVNLAYFYCDQLDDLRRLYLDLARRRGIVKPSRFWRIIDNERLIETIRSELPLKVPSGGLRMEVSVVRRDSGKTDYLDLSEMDADRIYRALLATTAVPILNGTTVDYGGVRYVDGGVAESVLLRRAQSMHERGLVLLSRPLASRRLDDPWFTRAGKQALALRSGPAVARLIGREDPSHNEVMDELQRGDPTGRFISASPSKERDSPSRTDTTEQRLSVLWADGLEATESALNELRWWPRPSLS